MKPRRLLPALALALLAGCSTAPPGQDWLALPAGLVLASDAGIRVSQQIAAVVEQGAVRQISVRLPATLPEAVVSGPLPL